MWGIFEGETEVHVIPCDSEGLSLRPHLVDDLCVCHPEVEAVGEDGRLIITHKEVH